MNNWNWFTPVALTTKFPITKFVINLLLTSVMFFKPINNFLLGFFNIQAVQKVRINMWSIFCKGFFTDVATLDNSLDWQIKFLRKFVITRVVSWHSHNSTSSVTTKNIISNPNWNFLIINWVNCISSSEDT